MNQKSTQGWDRGWEEHKLRQLQRMARWPLMKKLEWLEQAHHLAISLEKSRMAQKRADQQQKADLDSA